MALFRTSHPIIELQIQKISKDIATTNNFTLMALTVQYLSFQEQMSFSEKFSDFFS